MVKSVQKRDGVQDFRFAGLGGTTQARQSPNFSDVPGGIYYYLGIYTIRHLSKEV